MVLRDKGLPLWV